MNKAEFIEQISQKTDFTKQDIENVLDAAIEVIQGTVAQGGEVKLVGFGVFDQSQRQSRNAVHPKTGTRFVLPETKVPRFRPGKSFKERVQSR